MQPEVMLAFFGFALFTVKAVLMEIEYWKERDRKEKRK